jgi:hypothetical protein
VIRMIDLLNHSDDFHEIASHCKLKAKA